MLIVVKVRQKGIVAERQSRRDDEEGGEGEGGDYGGDGGGGGDGEGGDGDEDIDIGGDTESNNNGYDDDSTLGSTSSEDGDYTNMPKLEDVPVAKGGGDGGQGGDGDDDDSQILRERIQSLEDEVVRLRQ
ncbi:uncharacterized protein LOC131857551 [Cryptomeria japonica]|uniref:uncharacterized protein LOC131857551 n=1 Tax=Cryptomeria japonica TaxID=3369 RepID=UPI0027DA532F|nr:uncharacterized protein LOC131857551 [Cryptomeria japonica]